MVVLNPYPSSPSTVFQGQEEFDVLRRYKRQGLVKSSKSFARIVNSQLRGCKSCDEVAQIILQADTRQMDAINISTALVQLAKLHHSPQQHGSTIVYKKLITLLSSQDIKNMEQQVVSNVVWAMAKCGMASYNSTCQEVFIGMLQVAYKIAHKFPQQGLNNIVWAMGKSDIVDKRLFETSLSLLVNLSKKETIQPQSLSNVIWAMARCKHSIDLAAGEFEALKQVCTLCQQQLDQFSSLQMGTLMWSLRNIGYYDKQFMQCVIQHCEGKQQCFDSLYEMSCTLLAFSEFNIQNKHVITCALKLLQNSNNHLQQAVFNAIYSIAVIGGSGEFVLPVIESLSNSNIDNCQEIWLTQMYKSMQLIEHRENMVISVPSSFKDKCESSFLKHLEQQSHLQNQLLKDVVGCLDVLQIGWSFCQKDIVNYGADVLVLIDTNKVKYVKVLSPTCYIFNQPNMLTGSVSATIELFQSRKKDTLICIPYFEWSCCNTQTDKLNYIKQILQLQG